MDGVLIVSMVTAAIGAIPATIGALALLRRAMAPQSKIAAALRSLWDFNEFKGWTAEVPARIRRMVLDALEFPSDDNSDDQKE